MRALNAYNKQANAKSIWVWYEGSGSAQTLYEGQGVCFSHDYGTATVADARRYNRVEAPSSDNKIHFAGVLARDYTIPAGGTLVEVYTPGSVCTIRVAVGVSATVGETILECTYTAGTFKAATNDGKGVAIALQTITGGAAVLQCLAVLQEGLPSVGLAD